MSGENNRCEACDYAGFRVVDGRLICLKCGHPKGWGVLITPMPMSHNKEKL